MAIGLLAHNSARAAPETARETIVRAITSRQTTRAEAVRSLDSLAGQGDEAIRGLFTAWRRPNRPVFVYTAPDGTKVPVELTDDKDANSAQAAIRVDNGEPLKDPAGQPLRLDGTKLVAVEHDAKLRRAMKSIVDLLDLGSLHPRQTRASHRNHRCCSKPDKLPVLQARSKVQD